jgi:dTDP-glucose 4,6-dehydratase
VNIDRLDYCANETNVTRTNNYIFVKGDIKDSELVLLLLEKYHIDTVVHFAAQSHVDNSFEEWRSLDFTMDNVVGTHTLLECCRIYKKIHRFIHMSTDEVYGEVSIDHTGCCPERSLLNPTNPYAATKAGAEMLVRSYNHSFGLPTIVMRCNNVYGPNQYHEKVIPKFIHKLKNNQKCTIHGTGQTRRNFIHSTDVARAIDVIIEKGKIGKIYNIGTDNEYSVLEIATILINKYKPGEQVENWIEFVPDRYFNDFRYSIDSSELRKLGWEPSIPCLDV